MINANGVGVESIHDLLAVSPQADLTFPVAGYHPDSRQGGGNFKWDIGRPKADHNGGTVIDPWRKWPDWSNQGQVDAWFAATDSDGTGAFVRVGYEELFDLDFGASDVSRAIDHQQMMIAMLKGAAGRRLNLTMSPWRLSNTHILVDAYRGTAIVGVKQPDGHFTRIIRSGTVDTWRSCFHIATSKTFFDKLYFYADVGFEARAGLTYGALAGRSNIVGEVEGAYWRLGVVYPKDTPAHFELTAEIITAYHSGRAYASDAALTPAGNIRINKTYGVYAGFVDISGGSVEIRSHSIRGAGRMQIIKKGDQAIGGVLKVGTITATDCIVETRLTCAADTSLEAAVPGMVFTGSTSGVAGVLVGVARNRVDLKNVTGTFQVGETVKADKFSFVVLTVENWDKKSPGINGGIGNNGTHFDLIEIGSIFIDRFHGDPLWILNNGTVQIGRLVAKNIWGGRNLLRYSPNTNGDDPTRYSQLTIASFSIFNATMQDGAAYSPIVIGAGGRIDIGAIDMRGIVASKRANFLTCVSDGNIESLTIETTGGTYSRFLNFGVPGTLNISKIWLIFDGATRMGTSTSGVLSLKDGRYPAGIADFDGMGKIVKKNFVAMPWPPSRRSAQ
jgi:hypothetical protein